MLCSIATFGTVVVVVVAGAFVVGVDFGAAIVVVAIAASVVVVTRDVFAGVAPAIVIFRLAFPWKTDKIFFEVALSKSGIITAILSTI